MRQLLHWITRHYCGWDEAHRRQCWTFQHIRWNFYSILAKSTQMSSMIDLRYWSTWTSENQLKNFVLRPYILPLFQLIWSMIRLAIRMCQMTFYPVFPRHSLTYAAFKGSLFEWVKHRFFIFFHFEWVTDVWEIRSRQKWCEPWEHFAYTFSAGFFLLSSNES